MEQFYTLSGQYVKSIADPCNLTTEDMLDAMNTLLHTASVEATAKKSRQKERKHCLFYNQALINMFAIRNDYLDICWHLDTEYLNVLLPITRLNELIYNLDYWIT